MSSEDKEGKQRNEEIDNQLKRDKMNLRSEIKMLLLGMFISSEVLPSIVVFVVVVVVLAALALCRSRRRHERSRGDPPRLTMHFDRQGRVNRESRPSSNR